MTKAILILTFLLTSVFSSNAQNDASIEETKEWIEIYGIKVMAKNYFGDTDDNYPASIHLTEGTLAFELGSVSGSEMYSGFTISFKELDIITLMPSPHNYSDRYFVEFDHSKGNGERFTFENKESAKRFLKALKHYLSFYDYEIKFEDKTTIEDKF